MLALFSVEPPGHLSTTVCLFKALEDLLHFTQLKKHTQHEEEEKKEALSSCLMTDVPHAMNHLIYVFLCRAPPPLCLTVRLSCQEHFNKQS